MADETYTKADLDEAIEKAKEAQDAKNRELLDEVKKLKADLRKIKDISPEDMAAIEAERDKALADLAAAQKAAKEATAAADKAAKALEAEQGFTQRLLIQDGLKSALLAAGVRDEDYIDTLAARFARDAKVTVDGEERKALIGDKPLPDYIKEWAGTDAGKKFVSAAANSGGGAPGGKGGGEGGPKTLTREVFNALTPAEQMKHSVEGGQVVDAAA